MERGYRIFDGGDKGLFVSIESHYFARTDAKQTYIDSKASTDKKDDSLICEVR